MKYRIKQYRPGAWAIEELKIVPEINERTGKPNKNPGEHWKEIKYPGNLKQASERLLELVAGTEQYDDVKTLCDAVNAANAEISAKIEAYVRA